MTATTHDRRRRARRPRTLPTVLLTTATLVLAGCSGGDERGAPADPASTPSTPSAPSSGTSGSAGQSPTRTPSAGSSGPAPEGRLVWADEFDGADGGAPDRTSWRYDVGGHGWGQNQVQCYTDSTDNAATDGRGHLVITARYAPGTRCRGGGRNDWTSGKLITGDKVTQQYGTIEMRAKLPAAPGTWPAFWMLGANRAQVGWPACGEIDVVEGAGRRPTRALGAIHGPTADSPTTPNSAGGKAGKNGYGLGHSARADEPLSRAFHTYAVRWSPGEITWLLDGRPFYTATKAKVAQRGGRWVYDQPFSLILNLAVGGGIGGRPSEQMRTQPQQFVVDYVRVYR